MTCKQAPPTRRKRERSNVFRLVSSDRIGLLLIVSLFLSFFAIPSTAFRGSARLVGGRFGRIPQSYLAVDLRGGSTTALIDETDSDEDAEEEEEEIADVEDEEAKKEQEMVRSYRLKQHLYLQSRSVALRETLIKRGLVEFDHADLSALNIPKETDWDAALCTEQHPKSCLYSIDAEVGLKVIAPTNSTDWITISALNRLRRDDPTKIDPLWHSKFKALESWFGSTSKYTLKAHLPPVSVLFVTGLLDRPWLLRSVLLVASAVGVLVTLPFWEVLVQGLMLQPLLWSSWKHWARFAHAALPLKLFMVQLGYGYVSDWLGKVYAKIRHQLVEVECNLLQEYTPLTILEDDDEEEDMDEDVS